MVLIGIESSSSDSDSISISLVFDRNSSVIVQIKKAFFKTDTFLCLQVASSLPGLSRRQQLLRNTKTSTTKEHNSALLDLDTC